MEVVAEGPAGCSVVGSSCQGPAGDCSFADPLTSITVRVDNVDPADYGAVLANPLGVGEGNQGETTEVAFRVAVAGVLLDTLTVRLEFRDGEAIRADGDYSGTDVTLTFEPGDVASQVVLANVIGDDMVESNESFRVTLAGSWSNAHDEQVDQAETVVVINNDD